MNNSWGIVFALASAFCFSLTNVYAKKAQLKNMLDPDTGHFITILTNVILNGIVLIIVFLFRGPPALNPGSVFFFIAAGALNTMLGRKFLFKSIEYIGSPRAGAFKVIAPIFSFCIGIFLLHEKQTIHSLIGIIICLSGIGILTLDTVLTERKNNKDTEEFSLWSTDTRKGLMMGLLASIAMGSGNIFRRMGMVILPDAFVAGAIGSAAALLISIAVYFPPGNNRGKEGNRLIDAVKHIHKTPYLTAGIFSSLAIYFIFFSLRTTPVSIATPVTSSEAIFTALLGMVLLRRQERLSLLFFAAAALIICGITCIFVY